MKKPILGFVLFLVVFLVLAWGLGGRSGFDYGLTCTKCLQDYHVIERKFLGFTYSKSQTRRGKSPDYREITGHDCQHVYHKGGFGKSMISWFGRGIGCGMTAEGMVFRERNEAVQRTFELNRKLRNVELARETLKLIDGLLPPDFDSKSPHHPSADRERLFCFSWAFQQTNSNDSWEKLLAIAEHGTLEELSNQMTKKSDAIGNDSP